MTSPKYLSALLGMALLCACGNGGLKPSELKAFVENEENGYVQTVEADNFGIRCQQAPAEYLTVLSFRSDEISAADFEKRKAGYEKFDNYRLEITAADARNLLPLSEYFSFYMQEHITKICGTDTLPCVVYHAEPFNSIEKKQHVELGFEKTDCPEGHSICLKGTPMAAQTILIPFNQKHSALPAVNLR